jgi:hypothetical protein
MSRQKSNRSRFADYDLQRERAQQAAAMQTLNYQLDSLSQDGIARVVKRAFESKENQVASKSERGNAL